MLRRSYEWIQTAVLRSGLELLRNCVYLPREVMELCALSEAAMVWMSEQSNGSEWRRSAGAGQSVVIIRAASEVSRVGQQGKGQDAHWKSRVRHDLNSEGNGELRGEVTSKGSAMEMRGEGAHGQSIDKTSLAREKVCSAQLRKSHELNSVAKALTRRDAYWN